MFGGDFISYSAAINCSCEIERLSDREAVMLKQKPEEGKEIILAMIDRILHVQTDDDWFPIDILQVLYEMIGMKKARKKFSRNGKHIWNDKLLMYDLTANLITCYNLEKYLCERQ